MSQPRRAVVDASCWEGKRVFVTGHTGFKGSWLAMWLNLLGANVKGYALCPDTEPSLFQLLGLEAELEHVVGDIRDRDRLQRELVEFDPDIVFHLAAQPLVRDSYDAPVETYATNVMGTVHLLDAIRQCANAKAVVVVTSDKCYDNREWIWGYRETDPLGGYDPYSSSKAASELATASWRSSFFPPSRYAEHGVCLATARAGNVLGGGDWGNDRLIPDAVRSFVAGRKVEIRNPTAVRPWQHVLEALSGYLVLAQELQAGPNAAEAWNFGPAAEDVVPVAEVMNRFVANWGEDAAWEDVSGGESRHEAALLVLDCNKARHSLGWSPRTNLDDCLRITADWYNAHALGACRSDLVELTRRQIEWFSNL